VWDRPRSSIDWAQVEPVLAANVAGDHAMLERYERGEEKLYDSIARASGQSYKTSKTIILAAMYAEGLESSAGKLGITYKEAEALRAKVFAPLPRTRQLLRALKLHADRTGQVITTAGRVLDVEWYPAKDGREAGYAGYKAQNYFVQGSAYDELADTVVELDDKGLGDVIDIAMHDELIVLTEAADEVARIMSRPSRRLCLWSGRTPMLRTDRDDMGLRWVAAA
jgi:DNA polymerase-1